MENTFYFDFTFDFTFHMTLQIILHYLISLLLMALLGHYRAVSYIKKTLYFLLQLCYKTCQTLE